MGLHQVLSAIRTLILDSEQLPVTYDERNETYAQWFPDLTSAEREDLAKIPNEKLQIYTATIFTGESKIIQNHFKLTLKALIPAWEAVYNEPWKRVPFTRKIHSVRPWKSYETQAFVNSVRDALCHDLPELLQHTPAISDFARLEALAVEIKRAPDIEQQFASAVPLEALQSFTVDELLSLQVHVQPASRTLTLARDIIPVYVAFHRDGIEPELTLPETETHVIGSRTPENLLRWTRVPAGIANLCHMTPDTRMNTYAEVYAALDSIGSDEERFTYFMRDLVTLVRNNALALYHSS